MASVVMGEVFGAVGGAVLGPIGAAIGYGIGSAIGGAIDSAILASPSNKNVTGPRLENLMVQSSAYGKVIPIIYGRCRIAGNVIWSLPIKEYEHVTVHEAGGKGGGGGDTVTQTTYSYSVTLAIGICVGKVDEIEKVWADSKILNLNASKGQYRFYDGSEHQMPDSLMEAHLGKGNVPAYRGLSYVVIENFPLADYGNRIPNFTFEVRRSVKERNGRSAEELVSAMNIIPGSGEFVYDTKVRRKSSSKRGVEFGKGTSVNVNNHHFICDSLHSLNQLKSICPNVTWAAPVVCWFADSLDAGKCKIMPSVEFQNESEISASISDGDWRSENFTRENARLMSKDENGRPNYGGTVSDDAILRYLDELRNRNLRIMFYPMIFVDLLNAKKNQRKPWRGRIKAKNREDVMRFFKGPNGFDRLIIHYANLVKGKVDAFLIGSELKELTMFRDENGNFPAVECLIYLASQVKKILGPGVKISYGADWSEYHHQKDGFFHLDELWASENIDFIGIDAYFPLTDSVTSVYDKEELKKSWESGECYDFYYDASGKKMPLNPNYAIKNIKHWWENEHVNPNGQKTAWRPRSKKIWFTEYGFPSVDCASNQPNVFHDPTSIESAFPRLSKGSTNFAAQKSAIEATEEFWQNSEMIERKFLWCWDARPFPFWPDLHSIWSDGQLWQKGHWVNGKFGLSSLAAIVKDICLLAGLKESQIDVTRLQENVDGFFINSSQTARNALESLQKIFFFDIIAIDGILQFIPRKNGAKDILEINHEDLCGDFKITKICENELPSSVEVTYIDKYNAYQPAIMSASMQFLQNDDRFSVQIPLVSNEQNAKYVAEVALAEIHARKMQYDFFLPLKYLHLAPSQILKLNTGKISHIMRITSFEVGANHLINVKAVSESNAIYDFVPSVKHQENLQLHQHFEQSNATNVRFLDIRTNSSDARILHLAATSNQKGWGGALVLRSIDGGENFTNVALIKKQATMGKIITQVEKSCPLTFDWENEIEIVLDNGEIEGRSRLAVLNGANLALIGNELIQFEKCEFQGDLQFKIWGLLRGKFGTEPQISNHEIGTDFILIDENLTKVEIPEEQIGLAATYKILTLSADMKVTNETNFDFTFEGNAQRPLSPVAFRWQELENGEVEIAWKRRAKNGAWKNHTDVPIEENSLQFELKIFEKNELKEMKIVNETSAILQFSEETLAGERVVEICQISEKFGRSQKLEFNF